MQNKATRFIATDQLEDALGCTSMDARKLVRTLLTSAPYSDDGRKQTWGPLAKLKVSDMLNARVKVPDVDSDAVVSGFYAASLLLAKAAAGPLVHSGLLNPEGYESSERQLQAFYSVCKSITEPVLDETARAMLEYAPAREGFFRGYVTFDIDELEAEIKEALEHKVDRSGVRRIFDAVLQDGHRTTIWRTGYESVCREGEKLYDISALQTDLEGNPRMYADLRVAYLPADVPASEAFWTLDAYDDDGLELGYGLKRLVRQGHVTEAELFDGKGIVHLQVVEVRKNLRGQGLGARFLRHVLQESLKDLRPGVGHLVATAVPMQFDYPLMSELPAEFLLDALDSAERLQEHLGKAEIGQLVRGLKGKPIMFMPQDSRAVGPHLEQLQLLSENVDD